MVPGMNQFELIMTQIGLLGSPALFQKLVEMAMNGLINVIVYINEILQHSRNHFEHKRIIGKSFITLRNAQIKVNLAK
jgi:hypothetical protein